MKVNVTFRPLRFAYTTALTVAAVVAFGWWVLLPMLLIQADLELEPR